APPPQKLDWLAAFLSYLVPGLGQIQQGRVGKGILFMLCLYALFFYGMFLGDWKNVYLPHTKTAQNTVFTYGPLGDLENRLHFVGQFWIGTAAWPAIIQYATFDPDKDQHAVLGTWMRGPYETDKANAPPRRDPILEDLNNRQRNSDKKWDL